MRMLRNVFSFRCISLSLFLTYASFAGFSVYYVLHDYIPKPKNSQAQHQIEFYPISAETRSTPLTREKLLDDQEEQIKPYNKTVEIWGKAAIGHYLWIHILQGSLHEKLGGIWSYGFKVIQGIHFHFRTGPGVVPGKVPRDVENLILVLNGREASKVEFAQGWIDYIHSLPSLKHVAVVLLGNEKCDNGWIKRQLMRQGEVIQFIFLVYDDPDVDDYHIYQWPLGVATYRGFPLVEASSIPASRPRRYLCNFLGTVYANSSRERLLRTIRDHRMTSLCHVQGRNNWLPEETEGSREEYIRILSDSDITLNPVGKNTECYRIYEAMSLGSIPVIEDVMTEGHCGSDNNIPLRLLKKHKAPVEYISNFEQLPHLIEKYQKMPLDELVRRRKQVLSWYIAFKETLRDSFVEIVKKRFFK